MFGVEKGDITIACNSVRLATRTAPTATLPPDAPGRTTVTVAIISVEENTAGIGMLTVIYFQLSAYSAHVPCVAVTDAHSASTRPDFQRRTVYPETVVVDTT